MDETPKLDRDKVFSQTSIWRVIALYEGTFPRPFPAYVHSAFAFFICLAFFIPSAHLTSAEFFYTVKEVNYTKLVHSVSSAGLTTGVGLLSVAIAGFAILASAFDIKVLIPLLTKMKKENNLPIILFIFSFFVYTLATLFFLIVTSIFSMLISTEQGSLNIIALGMLGSNSKTFFMLVLSAQIAQIVFVLSIIKSFIWNLYETLLTIAALRVAGELKEQRQERLRQQTHVSSERPLPE